MGAISSSNTSTEPCAANREGRQSVLPTRAADKRAGEFSPGRVWIPRVILPVFAASAMLAAAMGADGNSARRSAPAGVEPMVVAKYEGKPARPQVVDFVLAEVRKRLDPNPETEIVELEIDPDYHGGDDAFLVNAVLDAHGRKLTLGVMVTVQRNADELEATLGYVD